MFVWQLMSDPAVLFLDEPTSGLDSYNAGEWAVVYSICLPNGPRYLTQTRTPN